MNLRFKMQFERVAVEQENTVFELNFEVEVFELNFDFRFKS